MTIEEEIVVEIRRGTLPLFLLGLLQLAREPMGKDPSRMGLDAVRRTVIAAADQVYRERRAREQMLAGKSWPVGSV